MLLRYELIKFLLSPFHRGNAKKGQATSSTEVVSLLPKQALRISSSTGKICFSTRTAPESGMFLQQIMGC